MRDGHHLERWGRRGKDIFGEWENITDVRREGGEEESERENEEGKMKKHLSRAEWSREVCMYSKNSCVSTGCNS